MPEGETRWVARLTSLPTARVEALLGMPLGLDVWEIPHKELTDGNEPGLPPGAGGLDTPSVWRGFLAWAEANLDSETAEAAIVLRRALHIAHGRIKDLDVHETGAELLPMMSGTCYTFTPGRADVAVRMKGSTRDFSERAEEMLA